MSNGASLLIARSHGLAADEALAPSRADGCGEVVGVFSSGCYAKFGNDVLAVGAIPSGPIHVVIDNPNRDLVVGAHVMVDLSMSVTWSPTMPNGQELGALQAAGAAIDIDDLIGDDLESIWDDVRVGCSEARTSDVTRCLVGRGVGLTPTGDDVLAGLMLVDAWRHSSPDDVAQRVDLVEQMRTTRLSQSFLRWAAAGQSIAPVHELFDASSSSRQTFAEATTSLCAIGGSSGKALLAGLLMGLDSNIRFSLR